MQTRILLLLIVVGLVVLNAHVFLSPKPPVSCYKEVCFYGASDAGRDLKALRDSSSRVFIVAEGDVGRTQKNALVDAGFAVLSKNFGGRNLTLIGLRLENGTPATCACETVFANASTAPCADNSTAYCTSIKPDAESAVFRISYPAFAENRVVFANRMVEVEAKTGEDAYAIASLIDRLLS